jgi:hypothetical protein
VQIYFDGREGALKKPHLDKVDASLQYLEKKIETIREVGIHFPLPSPAHHSFPKDVK